MVNAVKRMQTMGYTDDFLKLVDSYGDEFVDAFKQNGDEAVEEYLGLLEGGLSPGLTEEKIKEIVAIPKGYRPDPITYLSEEYIQAHLKQFENGGAYILPESDYDISMPSGNEAGANSEWIPGGYTSGGVPEAVVYNLPNDSNAIDISTIILERKK